MWVHRRCPQLSAASGNPQASILVPPYNYGCALVLRAQAEDSTGAVAVSAGVPYDVNSTAPGILSVSHFAAFDARRSCDAKKLIRKLHFCQKQTGVGQ